MPIPYFIQPKSSKPCNTISAQSAAENLQNTCSSSRLESAPIADGRNGDHGEKAPGCSRKPSLIRNQTTGNSGFPARKASAVVESQQERTCRFRSSRITLRHYVQTNYTLFKLSSVLVFILLNRSPRKHGIAQSPSDLLENSIEFVCKRRPEPPYKPEQTQRAKKRAAQVHTHKNFSKSYSGIQRVRSSRLAD